MSNGRNPKRRGHDTSRDQGGFIALPWSVMDSPAYGRLSHPARSLLLEIARQIGRDNNGRLLASLRHLESRGWKSWDVITRAKRELLDAGFIFETVVGHRPNKASWYAVTWRALDKMTGFDAGAAECFVRGAYMKTHVKKNDVLTPSHGAERPLIAPSHGAGKSPTAPSHGAIRAVLPLPPAPSHGDHLDMPSVAAGSLSYGCSGVRLPASLTLIGKILRRTRPSNGPARYAAARDRFVQLAVVA